MNKSDEGNKNDKSKLCIAAIVLVGILVTGYLIVSHLWASNDEAAEIKEPHKAAVVKRAVRSPNAAGTPVASASRPAPPVRAARVESPKQGVTNAGDLKKSPPSPRAPESHTERAQRLSDETEARCKVLRKRAKKEGWTRERLNSELKKAYCDAMKDVMDPLTEDPKQDVTNVCRPSPDLTTVSGVKQHTDEMRKDVASLRTEGRDEEEIRRARDKRIDRCFTEYADANGIKRRRLATMRRLVDETNRAKALVDEDTSL